jgi:hypothetical protein
MPDLVSDSFSPIGNPAAFPAAGYVGCMRYLRLTAQTSSLTARECERIWAAGLLIGLNHESTADAWRGGTEKGLAAGFTANTAADALGFPATTPIYYTPCDEGGGQIDLVRDYLTAAATQGPRPVGLYWGIPQIDQLLGEGVISHGWIAAAYAWSAPRKPQNGDTGGAHLLQKVGSPTVGGTPIDVNEVLRPDWGGWHPDQGDDALKVRQILVRDLREGRGSATYCTTVTDNADGSTVGSGVGTLLPDGAAVAALVALGLPIVDISDDAAADVFLAPLGVLPDARTLDWSKLP